MLEKQKLDIYQENAVYTKEKNVLIVAPPGSGKTTVIMNRTAHLIKNCAINPDNMIIMTFTKAAAMNMKQRYMKLSNSNMIPFFGTFHALFYKILSRYQGKLDIISSNDTFKLINGILVSYLDSVGEEKVKEVINDISLFKSSEENIEYFNSKVDKSIFVECLNLYERYKQEKGLKDFDDLQLDAKALFIKRPELLQGYRKLFKYILVDEFQDCDKLQIELLQMLGEGNSIFAVGDEDQCIYGFRGSRPDCMVEFEKYFKHGKKIFLQVNYRSTENIVSLSKNIIENNKNRNNKEIKWNNNNQGVINFYSVENEKTQAEKISESIQALASKNNYDYNNMAVLYRTNMESRSIVEVLLKKNIPFRLLDREYNFFEHFICRDIIAYLKLSLDVADKESFVRIINKPFRYVSKVNIEKVRRNSFKENCFQVLKDIVDIPVFQIKNIERLEGDILRLNKMYLKDAINYIIYTLGYLEYIKDYCQRSKIDVEELKDIMEEFKESAEDYMTITSFLAHVQEVKEQLSKKRIDNIGVVLSTIHGVKGMEFGSVHIVNCNEGVIPHINSLPEGIEEERRLFYVGVTRAIENLNIYSAKTIKGKAKEVSRFRKECGLEVIESTYDKNELKGKYEIGSYIIHKTYGEGKISGFEDKYISILFSNGVERKFDAFVLESSGLILKNNN
ncbi:ATP-dependent helicase [Clostridium sp. DJ247]|uniref:ATP-dependent helicase n=1 Tax=Clostridium sp. DJ247 TaxID=2726188 RepID=UPI001626F788|nr:ATP-dependent helicase [Clostridium sp. DJ247]MBC2580114.1 ATP-dependent helicase [Clostridium sp. DJ247]